MQLGPSLFSLPISWKVVVLHFVSSNTLMRPDKNTSNELLHFPFSRKMFSWLLDVNEARDCGYSAVLVSLSRLLHWCSALNGAIIGWTGPAGWC